MVHYRSTSTTVESNNGDQRQSKRITQKYGICNISRFYRVASIESNSIDLNRPWPIHFPLGVTRQLDVSKSVYRRYLIHGNSILLANLVYVIRQTLRVSLDIGRHSEAFIKNASSRTLESICKFDAQDTLPELQHDFCKLWNQLVHAARNGEHIYVRDLSLATLKNIRRVYIALHEGTDALPTAFATLDDSDAALDDIISYRMCTIDNHKSSLPGGLPNLQEKAADVTGDATQPPVNSPVAALPTPESMTSNTAITFPSPSPSLPTSNPSQVIPAHQGAPPTDQSANHENHSAPQAPRRASRLR